MDSQVYLRALEETDLERTWRWHNDPALYRWLCGNFQYVSHATERDWLAKAQGSSPSAVNLAICLRDGDRHIGNIYLRDIDWRARHGEVGIFIGEAQERGHGRGSQALKLLINHAFGELGLARLHLSVLSDNQGAERLYTRLGFRHEGRLRRHILKNGQLQDVTIMGLCREEWTGAATP